MIAVDIQPFSIVSNLGFQRLFKKNKYVDSSACVKTIGDVSERFRIESWVRQGYIMPPWLFNVYMDAVIKKVRMGMGRKGVRFLEKERDSGDYLASSVQVTWFCVMRRRRTLGRRWFVEVCRRTGLNVNVGKSKGMVLNGKEGLECDV